MTQTSILGDGRRSDPAAFLSTLALIQVNWDENSRSYLDQFVPFVIDVMRLDSKAGWTESAVRDGLFDTFGLDLPIKVVGSLIRRGARTGSLKIENHEATLVSGERTDSRSIVALRADCLRRERTLVDALKTKAHADFGLDWTASSAENALAMYIEEHSVPLLSAHTRGTAIKLDSSVSGAEYVVSSFVYEIVEKQPQLFEYLDEMVKGSMLASALYAQVSVIDRKFYDTTLYIDAPLCLKALGYEGEEGQEAVCQVLDMARSQGARIACFEHTVSEIRGVLQAAQNAISSGFNKRTSFAVAEYFSEERATRSDIEKQIVRVADDIRSLNMFIDSTPGYSSQLGIDELTLREKLDERIRYRNPIALDRDVSSVTAVDRLRRGRRLEDFEHCRAVLVTDNDSLASVARTFFSVRGRDWPLVMNDNDVAALLWVKAPQRFPNVPRVQLIADCVSSLSPSPELWESVLEEVDRLAASGVVSEDDVALMRWAPEAHRAVMRATLGEVRSVSTKSVTAAVAHARETVSEPVRRELDEARASEQAARNRAYEFASDNTMLKSLEKEQGKEIRALRQIELDRKQQIHFDSKASGRRAKLIANILSITLVVAATILFVLDLGLASRIASGVLGLLGVFGGVSSWLSGFEGWWSSRSEKRRLRIAKLDSECRYG